MRALRVMTVCCEFHGLALFFLSSPQNNLQAWTFDLVQSRKFEFFIMVVISINMVIMTVQHYGQDDDITFILDILSV